MILTNNMCRELSSARWRRCPGSCSGLPATRTVAATARVDGSMHNYLSLSLSIYIYIYMYVCIYIYMHVGCLSACLDTAAISRLERGWLWLLVLDRPSPVASRPASVFVECRRAENVSVWSL